MSHARPRESTPTPLRTRSHTDLMNESRQNLGQVPRPTPASHDSNRRLEHTLTSHASRDTDKGHGPQSIVSEPRREETQTNQQRREKRTFTHISYHTLYQSPIPVSLRCIAVK